MSDYNGKITVEYEDGSWAIFTVTNRATFYQATWGLFDVLDDADEVVCDIGHEESND